MSEFKAGLYHVQWWLRGVYGDPEGEFDILTSDDETEIRDEAWRRAQAITSAGRPEYIEYTAALVTPAEPPAPSGDDALNSLEVAYIEATAGILKDDMTLGEWEAARQLRQETSDRLILALKARLDAVTKRAERAEKALRNISKHERYIFLDTPPLEVVEGLQQTVNQYKRWAREALEAKESTDGWQR